MSRSVKFGIMLCISILIICVVFSAEAKVAGLPDVLMDLVDEPGYFMEYLRFTDDFSDYFLLTADEDTLAGHPKDLAVFVLYKGNICVLFCAKEEADGWELAGWSRQAVYPTLAKNLELSIAKIDAKRFELSWANESFTFYCKDEVYYGMLDEVVIMTEDGQYKVNRTDDEDALLFENGETSMYLNLPIYDSRISWKTFNPLFFPKSFEDVERSNAIFQKIPEAFIVTSTAKMKTAKIKKSVIVYNRPDIASKVVDMSMLYQDDYYSYYGMHGNWHFIRYQNGVDRAYFGYIQNKYLPFDKREQNISQENFINVPLLTAGEVFLTDDPVLSQEPFVILPSGTEIIGLSGWDAYYVYVEVVLPNETLRGFVPIKNLLVE